MVEGIFCRAESPFTVCGWRFKGIPVFFVREYTINLTEIIRLNKVE